MGVSKNGGLNELQWHSNPTFEQLEPVTNLNYFDDQLYIQRELTTNVTRLRNEVRPRDLEIKWGYLYWVSAHAKYAGVTCDNGLEKGFSMHSF